MIPPSDFFRILIIEDQNPATRALERAKGRALGRPQAMWGPRVSDGGSEARALRIKGGSEAQALRVTGGSEARALRIKGGSEARALQVTGGSEARALSVMGGGGGAPRGSMGPIENGTAT